MYFLRNTYFILWVCFIVSMPSAGQLNESDTASLQCRLALSGNYQQGNVEVLTLKARAELTLRGGRHWVYKTQNASLFQEFSGRRADNDLFSRHYLYYRPERRLYPFGISYISANFRRKVDLRWFAGAGLTWQVLNRPGQVIKCSAGAVYEQSGFNGNQYSHERYNGCNQINLWRGSFFMMGWHYLAGGRVRLYYDAYWQPATGYTSNYRTQYDIGVDLPVWKGLSVTALYTFTRENVVIRQVQTSDRLLSWGLSWQYRNSRGITALPGKPAAKRRG